MKINTLKQADKERTIQGQSQGSYFTEILLLFLNERLPSAFSHDFQWPTSDKAEYARSMLIDKAFKRELRFEPECTTFADFK